MRFAHIADMHLGFFQYQMPQRRKDYTEALNNALNIIKEKHREKKVDFVLIAGDTFNSKHPGYETQSEFDDFLSELQMCGIMIVAVTGNHCHTSRMTWVEYFGLDTSDIIEGSNYDVYRVDYSSKSIDNALNIKINNPDKFNILLIHAGLDKYFGKITNEVISKFKAIGFDYVALGDIHVPHIVDGFVFNPGSTEYTSSSQWDDPGGVFIIDVDDNKNITHEHILNDKRTSIKIEYSDDMSKIQDWINNIDIENGSMVSLSLYGNDRLAPNKVKSIQKYIMNRFNPLSVKITNHTGNNEQPAIKHKSKVDIYKTVFPNEYDKVVSVINGINNDAETIADLL